MSSAPLNSAVLGAWPMATNRPPALSGRTAPSLVLLSLTPTSQSFSKGPTCFFSVTMSQTSASSASAILGLALTRSTMILEARNSARRCTSVTLEAKRVKNSASSSAESPPPTTTSSSPL